MIEPVKRCCTVYFVKVMSPAGNLWVKRNALIGFRGLMLQALFEKHNSFLRPLKKKGFKEKRVTTIGLYDIGKSHDPGIQQEPFSLAGWFFSVWGGRTVLQMRGGPHRQLMRYGGGLSAYAW